MSKNPETLRAAQARCRRLQKKLDGLDDKVFDAVKVARAVKERKAAGWIGHVREAPESYVGSGVQRARLLPPAHPISREELCQLRDRLLAEVREKVKAESGEKGEFDYYWQISLIQTCNEAISALARQGL